MSKAETIPNSCPLCGNDTKGNDKFKFFCEKCDVLFARDEFARPVPKVEKKDEFASQKMPAKGLAKDQLGLKYFVSSMSNRCHRHGCRYIRQINIENLFYYSNVQDCEKAGYMPCICVRKPK